MVESTLRTADRNLPVEVISASRGKQQRAEPVAALYEQGKVSHAGRYDELETQMTTWDPAESDESPDRVDALTWAMTELMLNDPSESDVLFV
jgi:phage terminase large subunit-like protein